MLAMAKPRVERYWTGALEKCRREGVCRVCGSQFDVQAAHTVGRKYDELAVLEDGSSALFVDPVDIVPLCMTCHRAYDARELSLLEHMTYEEQAAAVEHLGIVRALHRLTGQRMVPAACA